MTFLRRLFPLLEDGTNARMRALKVPVVDYRAAQREVEERHKRLTPLTAHRA